MTTKVLILSPYPDDMEPARSALRELWAITGFDGIVELLDNVKEGEIALRSGQYAVVSFDAHLCRRPGLPAEAHLGILLMCQAQELGFPGRVLFYSSNANGVQSAANMQFRGKWIPSMLIASDDSFITATPEKWARVVNEMVRQPRVKM